MVCGWRTTPGDSASFKSVEGDEEDTYQTLFKDNNEGKGVFISLTSILRMCVEKDDATWTEIGFESKS